MEVGLMLEEVEMAPGALLCVVDRLLELPAFGAPEVRTLWEGEGDVKTALGLVENDVGDGPRGIEAQSHLHQVTVQQGCILHTQVNNPILPPGASAHPHHPAENHPFLGPLHIPDPTPVSPTYPHDPAENRISLVLLT